MTYKSICGVEGVTAAGIREGKFGLALIRASGTAAGVFTENIVRAAPVQLMRERIKKGKLEAVLANSGCANAYTGSRGYADAEKMSALAADTLGIEPDTVGIASTGVIGRFLDLPLIGRQCRQVARDLDHSESAETAAARAIMTTDTFPKHALVEAGDFSIGGITKGSGMIAPNMGTMLAFIYSDAAMDQRQLYTALKQATRRSFNRVVVDGDTSTNDIALCTATGEAGKVKYRKFCTALESCCRSLAQQIAADGEGATKLIEVTVREAPSEEAAAVVARTVIGSPLVKTAVYGGDPNWGRVVAAAGRAGIGFDPNGVSLWIGDGTRRHSLVKKGEIVADLQKARAAMQGKNVIFDLSLASGTAKATAWGCDLTEKYIEINGRYTS